MTALSPAPGSFQIDATVGGGGHALRILEAANPDGRLLGLDADARAIERAAPAAGRVRRPGRRSATRTSRRIGEVARAAGFEPVDGILLDLGLSSYQLADRERGFSFRADGPLDMRFDTSARRARQRAGRDARRGRRWPTCSGATARSRMRGASRAPSCRARARAAHRDRRRSWRRSSSRRAGARRSAAAGASTPPRASFQALRIAVNRELEVLPVALDGGARRCCGPGGRLVVISYHSLEDRIVKRFVAAERRGCICPPELPVCVCGRSPRLAPVGTQPQRPDATPRWPRNPRARSARAAGRSAARGMSHGHGSSRRRHYGRRQRELRQRRPIADARGRRRPGSISPPGWSVMPSADEAAPRLLDAVEPGRLGLVRAPRAAD